tara:strand:- start:682 stop:984 length:303 start_codon:yes stop_codon:yes gene_type:complete
MGKKRRMIANRSKFGKKFGLHPCLKAIGEEEITEEITFVKEKEETVVLVEEVPKSVIATVEVKEETTVSKPVIKKKWTSRKPQNKKKTLKSKTATPKKEN